MSCWMASISRFSLNGPGRSIRATANKNLTSAEGGAIVLPEGLVTKRADLGSSKVFRLDDAICFDHSGQYTAVGEFDYSGPPAGP